MRSVFGAAVLTLFMSLASAQQPAPPPPSPEMQALQARIMQELNANLQCSTANIGFQQELAKLKAELEEAKKK